MALGKELAHKILMSASAFGCFCFGCVFKAGLDSLPVGSLVVPFWDYIIDILDINHKKELLRSLWVELLYEELPRELLAKHVLCQAP